MSCTYRLCWMGWNNIPNTRTLVIVVVARSAYRLSIDLYNNMGTSNDSDAFHIVFDKRK